MPIQIYIARHASPDWSRTDIRYDVAPGPPLTPRGEAEARELGRFLKSRCIAKLYASPLERTYRTALLASEAMGISLVTEKAIAEWRMEETAEMVEARLLLFWERVCVESEREGPVCVVTHGGPLRLLLHRLGMSKELLSSYTGRFDNNNPAPPAGLWCALSRGMGDPWELEMVFMPRRAHELQP